MNDRAAATDRNISIRLNSCCAIQIDLFENLYSSLAFIYFLFSSDKRDHNECIENYNVSTLIELECKKSI